MALYGLVVWALQGMIVIGHQAACRVLLYLLLIRVAETMISFVMASPESKFVVAKLTALLSLSLWDKATLTAEQRCEFDRLIKHRGIRPNWPRWTSHFNCPLNSLFHLHEAIASLLERHGLPRLVFALE